VQLRIALLTIMVIALIAIPALAQNDLYNNGPTDGYTLGWTINFGFAVSDSFVMPNAVFNSLTFAAWLFPGDTLTSVEVSITSSEFGGTSFFDQTVNFTASGCFSNGTFNVCAETGSFSGVALNAGTYWLNLSNAVTAAGNPAYWDQNSGPSLASESSIGTIPSESFSLDGACGAGRNAPPCGPPPPTTPEPGSLLLIGSGVMALLGSGGLRKFF
jgi:hypothetical protein